MSPFLKWISRKVSQSNALSILVDWILIPACFLSLSDILSLLALAMMSFCPLCLFPNLKSFVRV